MIDLAPQDVALADAATDTSGEKDLLGVQAAHDGAGRAPLAEGIEQKPHRVLDLSVGIEHGPRVRGVDQPDRQQHLELAAARVVENAALQPRLQDVQFGLAHRALQPEQHAIVAIGRIVDAVLVHDERARQAANLRRRCQSALLRARRDTSSPSTIPSCPIATSVTRCWKPSRSCDCAPERPRSLSMTWTRSIGQPRAIARSRKAYFRLVLSVFSNT